MNNRLVYIIGMLVLFAFADKTSAQEWNKQDSLRLQEILNSDEELELNQQMIDAIDFGSGGIGTPMISTEKQWLMPDESLPVALPNKQPLDKKVYLSLRPYTANTPYDYDPVRQKKIKVNKDTWRNDPFRHFKTQFIYSNWAKSPLDKGVRNSLAEIEASGQRYNPITQSWHSTSAPTGNDFMTPFTKDFWNRSAVKRRRRTMEVLSQYGDSTTANINTPIIMPVIR